MVLINYRTASAAVLLLSIQLVLVQTFDQIASIFLGRVTDTVNTIISNGGLPVLQSRATRTLDNFKTDEFISYYGYIPEQHQIQTQDGYILTVFRCNSKELFQNKKEVVVLQHGILGSSDDFAMNPSHQSLAYVMADANYDVWLVNHRGNFYSRYHLYKNPNDPTSGFWDFSWDDIALLDYPATFEYIRQVTQQSKLYVVAHSQGTSALMALLAEKPEFNDQIAAASLMAPVAYLNHANFFYQLLSILETPLQVIRDKELFPRSTANGEIGSLCGFGSPVCNLMLNRLLGPKTNQRNDTMIPTYLSHTPSGISSNQLLHYGQELKHGFFGKRIKRSNEIPSNFPLHQITVPILIHYSTIDTVADAKDVKQLISELTGTKELHVQTIDNGEFDHIDFVWGIHAAEIVYPEIINFFAKF